MSTQPEDNEEIPDIPADQRGGFRVDGSEVGYSIEMAVIWRKDTPPTVDEVQTLLTNAYGRAFAEIDRRLGK